MGSTMGRAILSACLLPPCVLHLQGCGKPKEACIKGDKACKELQELLRLFRFIGPPRLTVVGETCSAVEFLYKGGLPVVYTYARQAKDSLPNIEHMCVTCCHTGRILSLLTSGAQAPQLLKTSGKELWNNVPFDPKIRRYRTMMYKLPPHKAFEVKLSDQDDAPFEGFNFSCPSKPRISDAVPMRTATSQSSLSFATICGLWPKRRVVFTVEAFSCDGESVSTNMTAKVLAMTPPGAPTFTAALVTHPASQASHAIYLALKGVGAMKLLCWMPFHKAGKGYLELPIVHKNHTHSRDAATLRDYDQRYHVHQEQQILVATRSVANLTRPDQLRNPGPDENLESPVSEYSMGNWLIMERYVKCLTSFSAVNPSYVSKPVELSWTEDGDVENLWDEPHM
eukprot:s98_g41.t1